MEFDNNIKSLMQNNDLIQLKSQLDSPNTQSSYIQLLLYAIKNNNSLEVVDLLLNYINYNTLFHTLDLTDGEMVKALFRKLIFHNNFIEDYIQYIHTNYSRINNLSTTTTLEELLDYFYSIIIQNNFYVIKYLLSFETKESLQKVCKKYQLFSLAVEKNQIPIIKYLIKQGMTGKEEEKRRDSLLYIACKKGYISMASVLLQHNALVLSNNDILDVIKLAVRDNNPKILECLLQHRVNIYEIKDKYGNGPLHWAVKDKRLECVNYLLENGAEVNEKNRDGQSPMFIAYDTQDHIIIDTLIMHNANLNDTNNDGETLLFLAVKDNDIELVKQLINHGANVNVKDKIGNTPLMIASHERYFQVVRWLVKGGANINEKNKYNDTALYYSSPVYGYKKEIYNLLKVRGAC